MKIGDIVYFVSFSLGEVYDCLNEEFGAYFDEEELFTFDYPSGIGCGRIVEISTVTTYSGESKKYDVTSHLLPDGETYPRKCLSEECLFKSEWEALDELKRLKAVYIDNEKQYIKSFQKLIKTLEEDIKRLSE